MEFTIPAGEMVIAFVPLPVGKEMIKVSLFFCDK